MTAMTAITDDALVDQAVKVFKLACLEKDWDVAKFFLHALEAIADREGDDGLVKSAYGELLEQRPDLGATDRTPFA